MRIGTRIIVVAALAAFATLSFGQGRGFGMFGGGQGGLQPASFLINRPDVQTDLKLTAEQKTKLQDMRQEMMSKFADVRQNDGQDFAKMQQDMKPLMDDAAKQVEALLTPEQHTRIHQIAVQLAGNSAALDPDVQKQLNISKDQIDKIEALHKTQTEANAAIQEKVRNQEISRQDAGPLYRKNQDALNTEIGKVLTDDQKAQLAKMGGAPFQADANPFGGGRGGL